MAENHAVSAQVGVFMANNLDQERNIDKVLLEMWSGCVYCPE